jgi:hypothetical protein
LELEKRLNDVEFQSPIIFTTLTSDFNKIIKHFLFNLVQMNESNCNNIVSLRFDTENNSAQEHILDESDLKSLTYALDNYIKLISENKTLKG